MRGHAHWIALALVLMGGGCKTAKQEARDFTRCSRRNPCRKPNVCLRDTRGGKEGICVFPCRSNRDCQAPFRCSGRYRLGKQAGRFCRHARVPEAGDCSQLQSGCLAGLRCFKNRCRRACKRDEDCPDQTTRCLKIVDDPVPSKDPSAGYQVCLKAVQQRGEACKPNGPFCARQHVCHAGRCLRICSKDAACGKGRICDGSLYTGPGAKARAARRDTPDRLYCRRAGKRDAYCNLRLDQTCARGLYCLGSRCRRIRRAAVGGTCLEIQGLFCVKGAICFAGRCRQSCSKAHACKKHRGHRLKCEEHLVHGKKEHLCL